MAAAVGETGAGHALAQAAFFEKIRLQTVELPVNEIVGLVDETEGDVGDGLRRARLDKLTIKLIGLRNLAAEPADVEGLAGVLVPLAVFADAEIIAIVVEKFFEAGASDAGEFDLGLFGSAGGLAALEEVLFAGAGGLDHLVYGAVALEEELVGEAEGDVEDDLGLVEGVKGLVIAARGNDAFGAGEEWESGER